MALAQFAGAMCRRRTTKTTHRRSGETGFSLIEVVIVASIITIGTALAVPAYTQWNARYQLRQATTELAGNLSLARMAARNQNASVTVTLAMVSGKVNVLFGGVLVPLTLPAEVTGFTGGPVQFSQLGMRVGGGAGNQLITLNTSPSQGLTYSIAVTPAGKTNWCSTAMCP